MPHLEPQAVYMKMLHVETSEGTELVPSDMVHPTPTALELEPFVQGSVRVFASGDPDVKRHEGWYARLSAPGYLDCTPWEGPFRSERGALRSLRD